MKVYIVSILWLIARSQPKPTVKITQNQFKSMLISQEVAEVAVLTKDTVSVTLTQLAADKDNLHQPPQYYFTFRNASSFIEDMEAFNLYNMHKLKIHIMKSETDPILERFQIHH